MLSVSGGETEDLADDLPLHIQLQQDAVRLTKNIFSGVPEDEDCFFFAELAFPYGRAAGMDTLVIYRWNRTYPFDTRMEFVPSENGFALEETLDFEGSSHPKITREIWKR